MGHHRFPEGKWTDYEEDIRVPLLVRGPGVPEGRMLSQLVLNNDLAPTFGELGGQGVWGMWTGTRWFCCWGGPSLPA
jgi:N-acetylglucosamine-6-sulfatase